MVEQAAEALSKRLREIDVVGWYERGCLGVILPETGKEGAGKIAEEIRSLVRGSPSNSDALPKGLILRIHTYPAGKFAWEASQDSSELEGGTGQGPDSELSVFSLQPLPLWKRAFDVTAASVLLLLTFPLFLVISVLIKLVSKGPVFFKQLRVGYRGKPFVMLKFRTMHTGIDNTVHKKYLEELMRSDKPMEKLDAGADPRLIPFGRLLRWSSLDELPQLLNVLRGDMSLIGPRPCLPYEAQHFEPWHTRRFDTMPGLTGLWQVSGKNKTTFSTMMRLDARYARKLSFRRDLLIALKTIPVVLGQFFERFFPLRRCNHAR